MLKFATGALVLLSCFGGPVHAEISPNFKNCLKYFYKETIPEGFTGVEICQYYKGDYRFATLYDRARFIPLYSAYILSKADGKRSKDENWMIEPQLISPTNGKEMSVEASHQNAGDSQAVDEDYRKASFYQRGHLAPCSHQKTKEDQEATYTLTNIVPQREGSNNRQWFNLEEKMLKRLKDCTSQMYVITGVIPHDSNEPKINEKVHVPEYLWTAYCCPSSGAAARSDQNHFPTYAAVGRNNPKSPEDIVRIDPNVSPDYHKGFDVNETSLEELEGILTRRLNRPINLFKDKCK